MAPRLRSLSRNRRRCARHEWSRVSGLEYPALPVVYPLFLLFLSHTWLYWYRPERFGSPLGYLSFTLQMVALFGVYSLVPK